MSSIEPVRRPARHMRTVNNEIVPGMDLAQLGRVLKESGFFPDTKSEAQAVVKVLAGLELGLGPISSMQKIQVFMGKVELSADLRAAMIKQSDRYDYRIRELTDTSCKIEFFERGESIGTIGYTIKEAQAAGNAGKDIWKKYPSDMLFATCIRKGSRRYCPDLFAAGGFAPDQDDEIVSDVERPALQAATRHAQIRVLAAATEAGWDDERRHRECAELFGGRMSLNDLTDDELDLFLGRIEGASLTEITELDPVPNEESTPAPGTEQPSPTESSHPPHPADTAPDTTGDPDKVKADALAAYRAALDAHDVIEENIIGKALTDYGTRDIESLEPAQIGRLTGLINRTPLRKVGA